jgi:hypothetical protein
MTKRHNPPVPVGRRAVEGVLPKWRDYVCALRPGVSKDINNGNINAIQKLILKAAQQVAIPVTTRKLNSGGLRVWRLEI